MRPHDRGVEHLHQMRAFARRRQRLEERLEGARAAQPPEALPHAVPVAACGTGHPAERRWRARDGDDELGLHAPAAGARAAAGAECARRHHPEERLLEAVVSGASLPGACLLVLRTKWQCEASDLALVLD